MNPIQIAFISFIFSLFFLSAPLPATPSDDPAILRVSFLERSVHLEGENLDLEVHFQAPSAIPDSAVKGDWSLKNTTERPMVLGGAQRQGEERSVLLRKRRGETADLDLRPGDLVAFRHIYSNRSGKEVLLKSLVPFSLEGEQKLFSTPDNYRILTQMTLKNGRPAVVTPAEESSIESDPFLVVHDPSATGANSLFIGAQSYYLHLFQLDMRFTGEGADRQFGSLFANCDFEGVVVPPPTDPGPASGSSWHRAEMPTG